MRRCRWLIVPVALSMALSWACDGTATPPSMVFGGPQHASGGALEQTPEVLCQKLVDCGMDFTLEQCLGQVDELVGQLEEGGVSDPWGLIDCVRDFPCSAFADNDQMLQLVYSQCGKYIGTVIPQRPDPRDTNPPVRQPDAGMSIPGLDSAGVSGDF